MIYSIQHGRDRKALALKLLPEHSHVLVEEDERGWMLVKSPWEFEEFKRPFEEQGIVVSIRNPEDFVERYPHIDLSSFNTRVS